MFSELLLEGRIKQFEQASQEKNKTVFIDRGIPDVVAYMDFIGDTYSEKFSDACLKYKYDKVFYCLLGKKSMLATMFVMKVMKKQ